VLREHVLWFNPPDPRAAEACSGASTDIGSVGVARTPTELRRRSFESIPQQSRRQYHTRHSRSIPFACDVHSSVMPTPVPAGLADLANGTGSVMLLMHRTDHSTMLGECESGRMVGARSDSKDGSTASKSTVCVERGGMSMHAMPMLQSTVCASVVDRKGTGQ
jgi:hypothetical protein